MLKREDTRDLLQVFNIFPVIRRPFRFTFSFLSFFFLHGKQYYGHSRWVGVEVWFSKGLGYSAPAETVLTALKTNDSDKMYEKTEFRIALFSAWRCNINANFHRLGCSWDRIGSTALVKPFIFWSTKVSSFSWFKDFIMWYSPQMLNPLSSIPNYFTENINNL